MRSERTDAHDRYASLSKCRSPWARTNVQRLAVGRRARDRFELDLLTLSHGNRRQEPRMISALVTKQENVHLALRDEPADLVVQARLHVGPRAHGSADLPEVGHEASGSVLSVSTAV